MSTPVGIIKKFVKTLVETKRTGTDAVNEAFSALGIHSEYGDYGERGSYSVFGQQFEAAKSGYSQTDFLEQVCGVRRNNTDIGAITGSDAGYSKTAKTAESIIPEAAKAKELTKAQYNSFTKNGLKVNISYLEKDDEAAGQNFKYSGANYLAKQKLVVRALYNWWLPESLDLINQSLGINFTDGRASLNEINIRFVNGILDRRQASGAQNGTMNFDISYDLGRPSSLTLNIDANALYNMTADDKNGTLNSVGTIFSNINKGYDGGSWAGSTYYRYTNYLDRLFLQAFTEIAMHTNFYYIEKLPVGILRGLWQIVGGFDDSSYDFYGKSGYSTDYTRFRWLAKNYSDGMPDGVSYNAKKTVLTVAADYSESSLDLADFESTIKNVNAKALKKNIKITGNALNNSIVSGSGNDYLLGGKGNDTLSGGKGNDTLKGGAGNDVFIYTAGKDVISDYAAGDKISLGAAISKTTLSGSDVVFTIGSGTLTVKNGKDKTLTLINSKGKESTTVVSGATILKVTNSTKSPLTIGADVGTVNASSRTKAITITGNKLNNVILGGSANDVIYGEGGNDSILGNAGNDALYGGLGSDTLKGGKGNDTLTGGAGNDSLWGDAGSDVFIYHAGEGNDVIFGFDKNDTLTLDSMDFTASHKSGVVTLKFEEGSVALKDFTASTFNINNDTYKISGTTLKKQ